MNPFLLIKGKVLEAFPWANDYVFVFGSIARVFLFMSIVAVLALGREAWTHWRRPKTHWESYGLYMALSSFGLAIALGKAAALVPALSPALTLAMTIAIVTHLLGLLCARILLPSLHNRMMGGGMTAAAILGSALISIGWITAEVLVSRF